MRGKATGRLVLLGCPRRPIGCDPLAELTIDPPALMINNTLVFYWEYIHIYIYIYIYTNCLGVRGRWGLQC